MLISRKTQPTNQLINPSFVLILFNIPHVAAVSNYSNSFPLSIGITVTLTIPKTLLISNNKNNVDSKLFGSWHTLDVTMWHNG